MNYKKVLAGVLAGTMVMGSAFTVLAADENGSTTGTGSLDIVEKADVFSVVLPTIPESGDTTFNYILDPTGVIKATSAEKYSGATFADGKTVYFANAATTEGGAVSYSDTSDALTITNKSTMDVDVKVKATVKAVDGIKMASSGTFEASDTEAKLYLALQDADTANTAKAITTDGVELTSTIQALAGAYETKYENGKYVKKLKADATGFKTYSFEVTGACNPNGAWNGLTENPPQIEVVWSVTDPTVTGPQVIIGKDGIIKVTNLDGALYQSMTMSIGDESWPLSSSSGVWEWEAEESGKKEFTLGSGWYPNFVAGKTATVKVTLKDGTEIVSAPVTFDAVE